MQPRCAQQPEYTPGSIPEAPEIRIPPYGHTVVVPIVFALEGFHCIPIHMEEPGCGM